VAALRPEAVAAGNGPAIERAASLGPPRPAQGHIRRCGAVGGRQTAIDRSRGTGRCRCALQRGTARTVLRRPAIRARSSRTATRPAARLAREGEGIKAAIARWAQLGGQVGAQNRGRPLARDAPGRGWCTGGSRLASKHGGGSRRAARSRRCRSATRPAASIQRSARTGLSLGCGWDAAGRRALVAGVRRRGRNRTPAGADSSRQVEPGFDSGWTAGESATGSPEAVQHVLPGRGSIGTEVPVKPLAAARVLLRVEKGCTTFPMSGS
jgi:hypothetical protein